MATQKQIEANRRNAKKAGRPKGSTSKPAFNKFMDKDQMQKVVNAMYTEALAGKTEAAKWLGDQFFGKAKQAVEHSGDEENPLKLVEIIKHETKK